MILIPEQVKSLKEKIFETKKQIDSYADYFADRKVISVPTDTFCSYVSDDVTDDHFQFDLKNLSMYEYALSESEWVKNISTDKIGFGTKFLLQFEGEDEEEEYTLTENLIGLKSSEGYISTESLLGKSLFGKKVGDTFSYEVNRDSRSVTINGVISKIITDPLQYTQFINSRIKANRICKDEIEERKQKIALGVFQENQISQSQYKLIEGELERLEKQISKCQDDKEIVMVGSKVLIRYSRQEPKLYTIVEGDAVSDHEISCKERLGYRLLNKQVGQKFKKTIPAQDGNMASITEGCILSIDNSLVEKNISSVKPIDSMVSRYYYLKDLLQHVTVAELPTDGTIGIGSRVSLMLFEDNGVQFKRVEVIDHAVSDELESDYVEKISSLGHHIFGLKNQDEFVYHTKQGFFTGKVYDIDNSKDANKTSDVTVYQKQKRG